MLYRSNPIDLESYFVKVGKQGLIGNDDVFFHMHSRSNLVPVTWSRFTGPVQVGNGHYGRGASKDGEINKFNIDNLETEMRVDTEIRFNIEINMFESYFMILDCNVVLIYILKSFSV